MDGFYYNKTKTEEYNCKDFEMQSSSSMQSNNDEKIVCENFQKRKQKRKIECDEKFVPQKRKKSSDKERQRNLEIKAVLNKLSDFMPYVKKKSLSRIRTLRLSSEYIKHLIRILQGETIVCSVTGCRRQLLPSDFEHIVHRELSTTNTYKERAEKEMSSSSRTSTDRSPIESPASVLNNNSVEKHQRYDAIDNSNETLNYEFKGIQQRNIYEIHNSYLLNKTNCFETYKNVYYPNNSF